MPAKPKLRAQSIRAGASGCTSGPVQTGCRSHGSQKQHTSMQRTMQAFHMQTELPTSKIPDCLDATLRATVHTKKDKISGWAGGPLC